MNYIVNLFFKLIKNIRGNNTKITDKQRLDFIEKYNASIIFSHSWGSEKIIIDFPYYSNKKTTEEKFFKVTITGIEGESVRKTIDNAIESFIKKNIST